MEALARKLGPNQGTGTPYVTPGIRMLRGTVAALGTYGTLSVKLTGSATAVPALALAGTVYKVGALVECIMFGTQILVLGSPSGLPTNWRSTASFNTGWTNFGTGWATVSFRRIGNQVFLRGLAKRVSGTTATIFTLPVGYRPAGNEIFAVISGGNVLARIDVRTTGAVNQDTGTASYCSLSGISFFVT